MLLRNSRSVIHKINQVYKIIVPSLGAFGGDTSLVAATEDAVFSGLIIDEGVVAGEVAVSLAIVGDSESLLGALVGVDEGEGLSLDALVGCDTAVEGALASACKVRSQYA